jgi:hypothetical protein
MNTRYLITGNAGQRVVTDVQVDGLASGKWTATDAAGNRYGTNHNSPLFHTVEAAQAQADAQNATEQRALNARAAREAACLHKWTPVSHEEDRCSLCGTFRFVPDL